MMIRLLWKEFREKRRWALVWAATILGAGLLGRGQSFCGDYDAYSEWIILIQFFSLLVGCSAYTSELTDNRIDFLCSQPIEWKRILLAKALFGLMVPAAAATLAAVIFRFYCADHYVAFTTIPRLAEGIKVVAWMAWTAYLLGLFCSVVIDNIVGGIVFVMVIATGTSIVSAFVPQDAKILRLAINNATMILCPTFAALSLLRFGISLSLGSRVKRYGLAMLLVLPILPAIAMTLPEDAVIPKLCRWSSNWSSVGPEHRTALVNGGWYLNELTGGLQTCERFRESNYMTRLSDGKRVPVRINLPRDSQYFWADSDTVYFYSPEITGMQFLQLTPRGKLIARVIEFGIAQPNILPAPDGRMTIVASQGPKGTTLEFLDTRGARRLNQVVHEAAAYWWQSDRQVGYVDRRGKRRTLNLSL